MIETPIYNCFNGVDTAYIYIWLSKSHQVVYVGMTNSYSGTIGRAQGHFNSRGTFRKRFDEFKGYPIETVDDFLLLSFPLPREPMWTSVERSYREAVEYLVYKKLIAERGNLKPTYDVVAWVRDSPRISNSRVKKLADQISSSFINNYNRL